MYLSIYHLSIYLCVYLSIHPSTHSSIITYPSIYIYLYPFILSLHIRLSTSLSTHQSTPVLLSVYTQCVVLLLGNMYNISTYEHSTHSVNSLHLNTNISTCPPPSPLNTVTRVLTRTRNSDTCPCIYNFRLAFVCISRVCTLMCATCSYKIMAVRILKLLIIPSRFDPAALRLLYGSIWMVLQKKWKIHVQAAEVRRLRGAEGCALCGQIWNDRTG